MRYHLFPFLIPKAGRLYELKTTVDSKVLYFKDETAWATMLNFLYLPWYRRLTQGEWISWEIVATKDNIRYFVWVPNEHIGKAFKSKYYSEHPQVEIIEVEDHKLDFSRPHAGTKFLTESHWAIPVKTYHNEVVDTQAELIEFLDGIEEGQEVHMQFLLNPAYRTERSFRGIVRQLHRERDYDDTLDKDNELYLSAIEGKSTRILSRLNMRVVAFGRDQTDAKDLIKSAKGSIGTFSSGRLNRLRGREWWWFRTFRPLFRWEYSKRIYSMERMKKRVVLGTEEMAAMMRLPSERVQNTKLNRLKMRSTPLPKEVKEASFDQSLAISLGDHRYHGQRQPVMFDLATLRYHAAFIGMSGMGKSTAMYNLVEELLTLDGSGESIGVTVIDPHGDLCQDIAARIPPEKEHLVRYVKFSEGEVPFNVYDVDFATSEDKIAQTVSDVLKRTWKDFWGPNIDDNFLNGGIALQRIGEASLPNLQRLLSDEEYRESVLERLDREDPIENDLYLYFSHLHVLKDRELQQKTNSTLNKLRKLSLSGVMGKMLRAKTNGLRFRESMDQGRINLLDLSELTSEEKKLIGSMCLTYCELAGKSRADTPASERSKLPHHVVMVDEAPTLMEHSTDAIESFASELRKYRTSIVLGMQGLKGQVPMDVSDAIFRNFGTFISFRLGNYEDALLVNKSLPSEVLTENDYLNIEPYHGYIRMQAGNERTRPFLVRMKEPGDAKFKEAIPLIKEKTIAEAMTFEKKAHALQRTKEIETDPQAEAYEDYFPADESNDDAKEIKETSNDREVFEQLRAEVSNENEKVTKQLQPVAGLGVSNHPQMIDLLPIAVFNTGEIKVDYKANHQDATTMMKAREREDKKKQEADISIDDFLV